MEKNFDIVKKGKELAYLLRHDKFYPFDSHGWRETTDLIKNHGYTLKMLIEIVATDDKGRYEWNNELTHDRIRARQGHSINVDVELKEAIPPEKLYHGTVDSALGSIMKTGISPMKRLYVHLSEDYDTAVTTGQRHHGNVVVLEVKAKKMYDDGIKFYKSRNNIWLVKDTIDYNKYVIWPAR